MKPLSAILYALLLVGILGPGVALAKPRLGFSVAIATDGFFSATLAEVKVASVHAGSASEKAGLKAGDLIVEVNGLPIKGASGLAMKKVLADVKPGEHLLLKVQRAGEGVMLIDIIAGT
ncbi:PDZ domain-containing protein [Luteimonas granuli]|uniref:PDZ domain-containing protein n=1 Tax=Luteimonas granuli TaxID=1176533 RepID=UPI00143DB3A6|nr:PDZ domain-containing protein [Luteimonas granuli]